MNTRILRTAFVIAALLVAVGAAAGLTSAAPASEAVGTHFDAHPAAAPQQAVTCSWNSFGSSPRGHAFAASAMDNMTGTMLMYGGIGQNDNVENDVGEIDFPDSTITNATHGNASGTAGAKDLFGSVGAQRGGTACFIPRRRLPKHLIMANSKWTSSRSCHIRVRALTACRSSQANAVPRVLQNRGFKVALLTDGRMSGASGKVLAAIQVTPEAISGGTIGKIKDDDLITIDAEAGALSVSADDDPAARSIESSDISANHVGMGRELFAAFRKQVSSAETGATIFGGE